MGVGFMPSVLLIYHTFTGNTKKMAEAVAEGAKAVEGVEVILKKVAQVSLEDFASADAIAFGAPNTFGSMAGALREFFDRAWKVRDRVAGKPVVAFTSENAGVRKALEDIERFFGYYRLKKVADGVVAEKTPSMEELKACRVLGRSLALEAQKSS